MELYGLDGLDVSPDLISKGDATQVLETVGRNGRNRPLEASYPLVFLRRLCWVEIPRRAVMVRSKAALSIAKFPKRLLAHAASERFCLQVPARCG